MPPGSPGQEPPHVAGDLPGRVRELQIGHWDAAPASRLEHAALLPVALERGPGPVELPAVDLDDHPFGSPDAVHLDALDVDVGLRARESGPFREGDEELLEVALGMRRPFVALVER